MINFTTIISSVSVLFLFASIAVAFFFPIKSYTSDVAYALFYWFLVLGIVRWIERGLLHFLNEDNRTWLWYTISIIALGFQIWFLAKGIYLFFSALNNIPS